MKRIVGGDAEDSGEVHFGEEGLAVIYRGDTHIGAGLTILSYNANRLKKVIKRSLEINEPIYWYWWILLVLGTNIHWLTS